MVAKSYQNLEQVGDIFISNGRQYVNVRTKTGNLKSVRWYTDAEYEKMYPEDFKLKGSQKLALGFQKEYITIFKGDTYNNKDWFPAHNCRYTRFWGWYLPSTFDLPEALPIGVEAVTLPWNLVGEGDSLISEDQVTAAVASIIYEESPSEYQGELGGRIEREVTIQKVIDLETAYGASKMFIMEDMDKNIYVWVTATKNWIAGEHKHIRGTVKDFRTYQNVRQTVLTRCQEVA